MTCPVRHLATDSAPAAVEDRRPAGRTQLLRAAGVQPVQARQRRVHLRTRPPSGRHRRHRHRPAPRPGAHVVLRRGPIPRVEGRDPVAAAFHEGTARGAATSIYLASAPEAEGVTGRYFANRKPKTSSKASYDTAAAARPWQISADLTGLNTRGRETQRRGS